MPMVLSYIAASTLAGFYKYPLHHLIIYEWDLFWHMICHDAGIRVKSINVFDKVLPEIFWENLVKNINGLNS